MTAQSARAVVRTFLQAFLGLLLPGLLGWLNQLTDWANDGGQAPFPDARSLAFVGIAAISAGFIAVVTAIMRGVEDATGKGFLRTVPPKPAPPDTGAVDTRTIAVVALVLAVIVVLVLVL